MKKLSLSLFFIISLYLYCFGQDYKYGKVSLDLLKLNECYFHKEAMGMITYKSGDYKISYFTNEGFKLVFEQKKQIKLFNDAAKNSGTIRFYYYSPKSSGKDIRMSQIKGRVYNLIDGKIVETKLKDENVFTEQFNRNLKRVTINLPGIQNNCVFEYEFNIVSNYLSNVEDYYIQEEFPVVYNQLSTSFPEFFIFQINALGGIPAYEDKNNTRKEPLAYSYNTNETTNPSSSRIEVDYHNRTLKFKEIKPYIEEPFSSNEKDYYAKIKHQLISIKWPNRPIENYAVDYQSFSKKLLELDDFGSVIKRGDDLKEQLSMPDSIDNLAKAEGIYKYFQKNVTWDKNYDFMSVINLKKLLKERKGDSGDINLHYIAVLNKNKIPTYPVILSTRGNGTLHPTFPSFADFDYVVALSEINGKQILSDATTKLPFGNLPVRALNGDGWLVSENGNRWAELKKGNKGIQLMQSNISLAGDSVIYNSKLVRNNYFAFEDNELIDNSSEENYLQKIKDKLGNQDAKVNITDKSINSIKLNADYSFHYNKNDDILLINAFKNLPFESNPFKNDERIAMVDFPYNTDYKYISFISLPPEYMFEVPERVSLAAINNTIIFSYIPVYNEDSNTLSINVNFKTNATDFSPLDYQELKKCYEIILNRLSSPVVISNSE